MLHYLGVLSLPSPKDDKRKTSAFGPDKDWRPAHAEPDGALFSRREGSDGRDPVESGTPLFASLVVPAYY